MTETAQPTDDPNDKRPGLVVDTGHLAVVEQALGELIVTIDVPLNPAASTSAALGLTRLTLRDADDEAIDELDGLLAEMRRRIAVGYGGWVPPMGKDREAQSAVTMMRGGNPKPTGLAPEPADADELTHSAAAPGAGEAPGVRIGLVDTQRFDWDAPPDDLQAWHGHAAFVAGIVEATAPGVELVDRAALTEGNGNGTGWKVASAVADLAAQNLDILLLPLACFTADGQPPLLMERAIASVPDSTLIIAAAGNQTLDPGWSFLGRGPTNPAWPAALPRVKAIGVDPAQIDEFEERPPKVQPWVDALTDQVTFVGEFFHGDVGVSPGVVRPFEGKAKWSGTSFSAAYAAGLVAAKMAQSGLTAIDAWDALLDDAGSPLGRPPVEERS